MLDSSFCTWALVKTYVVVALDGPLLSPLTPIDGGLISFAVVSDSIAEFLAAEEMASTKADSISDSQLQMAVRQRRQVSSAPVHHHRKGNGAASAPACGLKGSTVFLADISSTFMNEQTQQMLTVIMFDSSDISAVYGRTKASGIIGKT